MVNLHVAIEKHCAVAHFELGALGMGSRQSHPRVDVMIRPVCTPGYKDVQKAMRTELVDARVTCRTSPCQAVVLVVKLT